MGKPHRMDVCVVCGKYHGGRPHFPTKRIGRNVVVRVVR